MASQLSKIPSRYDTPYSRMLRGEKMIWPGPKPDGSATVTKVAPMRTKKGTQPKVAGRLSEGKKKK